jgi:hypothetical protein
LRFGQQTVLVGQSPDCTICLKDADVSPVHFVVSWRPDEGWVLTRHESAHPVLVNDASVDTCRLVGGEIIRIGDFALEFEGDEAPEPVLVHTTSARRSAARPSSSASWTVGMVLTGLAGAALTLVVVLSSKNGKPRDVAHKESRRPRSPAEPSDPRPTSRDNRATDPSRRAAGTERSTGAARRPARPRRPTPAGRPAAEDRGSADAREEPGSLADLIASADEADPAPVDKNAPAEPSRSPGQAVGDAPAKRLAIPEAAEVERAKAEVLAAYGDELATDRDGGNAVGRLIAAARESARPASKYALLDAAEAAALRSGAYRQAAAVIDARSQMFDVDRLESRLAMLTGVAKGEIPKDREVFDLAVGTVRDAIRGERFEVASKAATLSATLAAPLDPATTKTAFRLRIIVNECKALQRKYKAAVGSLAENSQDPRAREVVGTYVCFVKQDWKEGLASLAAGRDVQLKAIAVRELAAMSDGTSAADVFALGGAWWAYAEPQSRPGDPPPWYQEVVREHAADVYRRIVDKISDPVDQALARKRIEIGSGW